MLFTDKYKPEECEIHYMIFLIIFITTKFLSSESNLIYLSQNLKFTGIFFIEKIIAKADMTASFSKFLFEMTVVTF